MSKRSRKRRNARAAIQDDPEREDVTSWRNTSAPSVVGSVELRAEKGERMLLLSVYGLAEGRALYDEIVGDQRVKWKGDDSVEAGKVTVTCDRLEEIVEYKGQVPALPEPYVSYVERLYGHKTPLIAQTNTRHVAVPKAPPGAITLATICKEMGIEGRVARGALRKAKVAKPYAWADDSAVRAILKKIR